MVKVKVNHLRLLFSVVVKSEMRNNFPWPVITFLNSLPKL